MTMSMISSYTPDDFNQEEDLYGKIRHCLLLFSKGLCQNNYQNPVWLFFILHKKTCSINIFVSCCSSQSSSFFSRVCVFIRVKVSENMGKTYLKGVGHEMNIF